MKEKTLAEAMKEKQQAKQLADRNAPKLAEVMAASKRSENCSASNYLLWIENSKR